MKILAIIPFALATAELAQSIVIGFPPPGGTIRAGRKFTIEIDQPISIQGPINVGIALGLNSCRRSPCPTPEQVMGRILFAGPFTPKPAAPGTHKPPHENFTVEVPHNFPKGPAQLNVAYFALFGAGPAPTLQLLNETLHVR
ncbi:hypothetical protein AX17_001797 [Amanita inopinata Kibby_2008]|nr:hypothetical protein AX17_001797 [Amanita inopinata Kibby_2008]